MIPVDQAWACDCITHKLDFQDDGLSFGGV
jgi:hypothetical protein